MEPSAVTDEIAEVARDVFGHAALRPGQRDAIEAVLAGRDAMVLLPTGAGKSACYQVPAVVAARRGRGVTLVISPLIALMNDQVQALRGRGIAAAALHSQLDDEERRAALGALVRGELELVYVSPERAVLDGWQRLLGRARVALLAIDEAHCVSAWGHDFRPEYLRLAEVRRALPGVPAIALTATATPRVVAEMAEALGLHEPVVVRGAIHRPNLAFDVLCLSSEAARLEATIRVLDAVGLRARIGSGHGIVYCATRKKTEAVAAALKSAGFAAGHYHAGRTALARERAQHAFALGRMRVLVATSAFGMGVDYPDVRAIVHFQSPGSLEAYYQEAGRAGRDGLPARCVLLFGRGDLAIQRKIADAGRRTDEALAAVERYATSATCRQRQLHAHFTGTDGTDGTDDVPACGRCDACVDPAAVAELAEEPVVELAADQLQLILDAVGALHRPVGKGSLVKALRGSRAKAVAAHGLLHLPQHGALAGVSEEIARRRRRAADPRAPPRAPRAQTRRSPSPANRAGARRQFDPPARSRSCRSRRAAAPTAPAARSRVPRGPRRSRSSSTPTASRRRAACAGRRTWSCSARRSPRSIAAARARTTSSPRSPASAPRSSPASATTSSRSCSATCSGGITAAMSKKRIAELAKLLRTYKDAYYNDQPLVSDAAYDALEDQLRELAPDHELLKSVGAPVRPKKGAAPQAWEKAPHAIPMLSLTRR
ncbi:MAG: RecQ family ATP-dependent DNA helicase [Deltaproteobacteria bacterium]|nr:RecQ family ATP-dependent DNA helicase [Deltaproteobacteria bacterium]